MHRAPSRSRVHSLPRVIPRYMGCPIVVIGEVSRAHRFPNQVSFGESISLLLTSPITTIGQTSTVMLAGWLEPKTLSDVHDW